MRYVYMGQESEVIPDGATHIIVHESVTVIRTLAFMSHRNIVEVICHEKVEKFEKGAFAWCGSLRRVIMPGVTIIERAAFACCEALTDVECGKLERIEVGAFCSCRSLRSINLSSTRIIERYAFIYCTDLMGVKFDSKLERFEGEAFYKCTSLEQITIPLKDDLIPHDHTFVGCAFSLHVDLVEREILHETIAALHLEEWRNFMNEEIDPIKDWGVVGVDKAMAIRRWIRSVLGKITEYITEHRRLLDEDVVPTLKHVLPQDIVMNNIFPFLNLPPYTFEVLDRTPEGR